MATVLSILRSLFALFIGGSLIEMLLTGESYLVAALHLGNREQREFLLTGSIVVGAAAGVAVGAVAPKSPILYSGILSLILIAANIVQSEANGIGPLWYEAMLLFIIIGLLLGAAFWPYRERRLNRSLEH